MEDIGVPPEADGVALAVVPGGDPPEQGWPIQAGRHRDGQLPARGSYNAISRVA